MGAEEGGELGGGFFAVEWAEGNSVAATESAQRALAIHRETGHVRAEAEAARLMAERSSR